MSEDTIRLMRRQADDWARDTLKMQQQHLLRIEAKVTEVEGRICDMRRSLSRHMDHEESKLGEIREMQTLIRVDVAGLKVRAGIWGAIAGAMLSGVVGVLVWAITKQ